MAKKKRSRPIKRFNRRIVVAFLLILEVLAIVALGIIAQGLREKALFFAILSIFVFILDALAVLHLLYAHSDPEFKIPWLVVLLALPFVGVVLYLIFRQRSLPKKARAYLQDMRARYLPYFPKGKAKEMALTDPYAEPLAMLEASTDYCVFSDSRVTYFKTGEEFFPDFLSKLEEAKEFIFLEFFIVAEGKEWDAILEILTRKAKEGVDVRLLFDDIGCLTTLSSRFAKKLREQGIHAYAFNKVTLILAGVYNNRDHRKIAIIDHKYGYTGGLNLADEYANDIERFGYWKDTMIRVEGRAISALIAMFLINYDMTARTVSDYENLIPAEYETFENEGHILPFGTGPENFYPIRTGEANYISMIQNARREIFISTPYFIPSIELLHTIEAAALRGVKVHLILPGIPDKKLPYLIAKHYLPPILRAGAKVYFYKPGFNHMKTVLVDDELAFVGTINMDYRSLVHHFECGATLLRTPCLKDIKEDFLQMISVSEAVPEDYSLSPFQKVLCALLSVFIPLL